MTTSSEQAVLPDGRIAQFEEGTKKLLIDGKTYNVWRPNGGLITENILCSWEDHCGRCELCHLSGATAGACGIITSYRGPPLGT